MYFWRKYIRNRLNTPVLLFTLIHIFSTPYKHLQDTRKYLENIDTQIYFTFLQCRTPWFLIIRQILSFASMLMTNYQLIRVYRQLAQDVLHLPSYGHWSLSRKTDDKEHLGRSVCVGLYAFARWTISLSLYWDSIRASCQIMCPIRWDVWGIYQEPQWIMRNWEEKNIT